MRPGQQGPRKETKGLHDLLTSDIMRGARIDFPFVGLVYIVGEGWQEGNGSDRDGAPIKTSEAYDRIGRWWRWDSRTALRIHWNHKRRIKKRTL